MSPSSPSGPSHATLLAALASPARSAGRGGRTSGNRNETGARTGPLYWLPVIVALGVFAQVSLLGLRPAVRESARLAVVEDQILSRHEAEKARATQLQRTLRAQRDPIYLERERRLLLDPAGGLISR